MNVTGWGVVLGVVLVLAGVALLWLVQAQIYPSWEADFGGAVASCRAEGDVVSEGAVRLGAGIAGLSMTILVAIGAGLIYAGVMGALGIEPPRD